jgi:hypothetical protein
MNRMWLGLRGDGIAYRIKYTKKEHLARPGNRVGRYCRWQTGRHSMQPKRNGLPAVLSGSYYLQCIFPEAKRKEPP